MASPRSRVSFNLPTAAAVQPAAEPQSISPPPRLSALDDLNASLGAALSSAADAQQQQQADSYDDYNDPFDIDTSLYEYAQQQQQHVKLGIDAILEGIARQVESIIAAPERPAPIPKAPIHRNGIRKPPPTLRNAPPTEPMSVTHPFHKATQMSRKNGSSGGSFSGGSGVSGVSGNGIGGGKSGSSSSSGSVGQAAAKPGYVPLRRTPPPAVELCIEDDQPAGNGDAASSSSASSFSWSSARPHSPIFDPLRCASPKEALDELVQVARVRSKLTESTAAMLRKEVLGLVDDGLMDWPAERDAVFERQRELNRGREEAIVDARLRAEEQHPRGEQHRAAPVMKRGNSGVSTREGRSQLAVVDIGQLAKTASEKRLSELNSAAGAPSLDPAASNAKATFVDNLYVNNVRQQVDDFVREAHKAKRALRGRRNDKRLVCCDSLAYSSSSNNHHPISASASAPALVLGAELQAAAMMAAAAVGGGGSGGMMGADGGGGSSSSADLNALLASGGGGGGGEEGGGGAARKDPAARGYVVPEELSNAERMHAQLMKEQQKTLRIARSTNSSYGSAVLKTAGPARRFSMRGDGARGWSGKSDGLLVGKQQQRPRSAAPKTPAEKMEAARQRMNQRTTTTSASDLGIVRPRSAGPVL